MQSLGELMESFGEFGNRLVKRLRVGSLLSTKKGTRYRVIEPLVHVSSNGGIVPTLVLEKSTNAGSPQRVVIPVGRLLNLLCRGARHSPGSGPMIDWTRAEQRTISSHGTSLRRFGVASAKDQQI
jgi:hypothetical protein